jgi:hypothetical protein
MGRRELVAAFSESSEFSEDSEFSEWEGRIVFIIKWFLSYSASAVVRHPKLFLKIINRRYAAQNTYDYGKEESNGVGVFRCVIRQAAML